MGCKGLHCRGCGDGGAGWFGPVAGVVVVLLVAGGVGYAAPGIERVLRDVEVAVMFMLGAVALAAVVTVVVVLHRHGRPRHLPPPPRRRRVRAVETRTRPAVAYDLQAAVEAVQAARELPAADRRPVVFQPESPGLLRRYRNVSGRLDAHGEILRLGNGE